jgi:hypothetical protein
MKGGWPPTANAKRPTKKMGKLHITQTKIWKGNGMHDGRQSQDSMKL